MLGHRVANLFHQRFEVVVRQVFRRDGRVNEHINGAGAEDDRVARKQSARAYDADGHYRNSGLYGELETALLERLQTPVARARAFREDEGANAVSYSVSGAAKASDCLGARTPVNRDVACAREVPAEEWDSE